MHFKLLEGTDLMPKVIVVCKEFKNIQFRSFFLHKKRFSKK